MSRPVMRTLGYSPSLRMPFMRSSEIQFEARRICLKLLQLLLALEASLCRILPEIMIKLFYDTTLLSILTIRVCA